ncbi:hypothetical protein IE4771_PE00083 (plasmid) [Rhizobium etli bv. mimosae str. IE4771]|uniref:Uncharacterized protein n=1 Tax=Rhizobium etli bv. mimosae str. IE4771 TaxID=1432050 RepID=A0A060ICD2_RHIET|nr:hypothetical protein IE4771_PE00083 [Rhizobium sp. IE4771]
MLLEGGLNAFGQLPNQVRLGRPVAVRALTALAITPNFCAEIGFSDASVTQLFCRQLFNFFLT